MPQHWTADDLLDVLVEQAGLPQDSRPGDLDVTFADIGLDSLAYLQLQSTVADQLGVELPDDPPADGTLRSILGCVNDGLGSGAVA